MSSGRARWLLAGLMYFGAGIVLFADQPANAASQAADAVKEYRLWYRNYDSPPVRALVSLAFDKTPEYGPYTVSRSPEMPQGRVIRELEQQRSSLVDIANVATSNEREDNLLAIPIPIDGGLLGFRVCVVLKESLPMFEGIRTIRDFQKAGIRIGQGAHWPDTPILEVNGIPVITHSRYEILFRMLENQRFECFARGVSEVLFDLELEDNPDLVIEPDILLAYAMPSYFFVSKHDHETAQRLQLGMERAIEDGSFGEYLDHFYGRALRELALEERTVLVLANPYLTDESGTIGRYTLRNLRQRILLLSRPEAPASDPEP
ncbi:hypothetical protein [Marinobacter sp. HL-58]|uniref:hypothetical protein n=1 Tax=Marinobacter sp. HL-58 TaxID=1479237 RepID=UPI000487A18C|nr:hypothetical protein [Marinobacter sp. HL-58]KPQ01555.1 MAG: hypothetical protein HLUCCO03_12250 [Marinobacter sp. HL-58]